MLMLFSNWLLIWRVREIKANYVFSQVLMYSDVRDRTSLIGLVIRQINLNSGHINQLFCIGNAASGIHVIGTFKEFSLWS